MAESNIPDRIVFSKAGQQKQFILDVKQRLDYTWEEIAHIAGYSSRTVRSWVQERNRMPSLSALVLGRVASINLPEDASVLKWQDHARKSGILGGKAVISKYGKVPVNERYRQQKWQQWWENEGRHQNHPILYKSLPVKRPSKSRELSEFIGIILGDGTISKRQLIITLNRRDDAGYIEFLRKLIKDLFAVIPGQHSDPHSLADDIVISRTDLVNYFVGELGLKVGNKVKQQVDIPMWIKKENSFLRACIRGLVDTDGCVFTHNYQVKGKMYSYKKLSFTNRSWPLLNSVYDGLDLFGMNPRLTPGIDVRLDSQSDIARYFKVIGSHNPKHLKRYNK